MLKKISYNDNRTLKIKDIKHAHIKVYKCSYLDCPSFYFDKKNLNDHTLYTHHEVPVKWQIMPDTHTSTRFYNKDKINIMNSKIQKQMIRHTLLLIGMDINSIKKPLINKIKSWLNDKRSNNTI